MKVRIVQKNLIINLAILLAVLLSPYAGFSQSAQTEPLSENRLVEFGIESDLVSRYIWHGLEFSNGAVVQNTIWASAFNLTASVWTNGNLKPAAGERFLNEVDLSLAHEYSFQMITLETAILTYLYPDPSFGVWTAEGAVNLSVALPPITFFTAHNFDIKEYPGAYFGEIGLAAEKTLGEKFTWDAAGSIGWASSAFNEAYIGVAESGIQLYQFESGLSYSFLGPLYLRLHGGYSYISSDEIRAALGNSGRFQFGFTLGGGF